MELEKVKTRLKKEKKEKKPISKKKAIFAVILIALAFSGSFIIYFILQIALRTNTPMVVVVSGSMEPNINIGDLCFLEGKDPEDIKVGTIEDQNGDVIVFDAHEVWEDPPDDPVVHRVIGSKHNDSGYYFLTKGDNNNLVDEGGSKVYVPEDHIIGVVCGRIPYIGYVKIWLTNTGLFIPIFILVAVPLVISIIWDVVKGEDEEEKKGGIKDIKKDDKKIIEDKRISDDPALKRD